MLSDLPDQRSNPRLPFWQEDSLPRSQQSFFKDIDPLLQTIFSKVFPKPCQSFFFCLLSHFPLFLYIYASFVYNFPVIICNTTSAAATAKSLQSCLTLCDPIDGSPPRSPCPWDSPGKNTGVGCHFLLQCMKVKSESEVSQSCPTLSNPMDCSLPGSSIHGIFQARVLEWGAIAFSDLSQH